METPRDMRRPLWIVASSAAMLLSAVAAPPARAQPTYHVLLADGTELTADRISRWQNGQQLVVAGRSLDDRKNPIRLLRNTRLAPRLRGPRVYFTNGDILPGLVTGFVRPLRAMAQPAGLTVAPQPPLRQMQWGSSPILVRPHRVRRIVLTETARGPYRPGTALLHNGKSVPFQAVRWRFDGLRLLTAAGVRTVKIEDLAEIHMPAVDISREVINDALGPSPAPDGPVGRITTANGAILTFRAAMMINRRAGRRWVHFVQPAWSIPSIQVPETRVCSYSFRQWNEIPLSLLPAETLGEKSFTGSVWKWRRDRNVRGEALHSGTILSDLGVATHSYSAVAFDLPKGAAELTFLVGLDRAVGAGGCVTLEVRRDRTDGKLLWKSGFLRGRQKPIFVGPLAVGGASRLVLVTDFAHAGRPEGADPGDIRDEVDWLLPTVRIDGPALRRLARIPLKDFPGLRDWSGDSPEPTDCRYGARWNVDFLRWDPRVVINIRPRGLTLTRTLQVTPDTELLRMTATAGRDSHHWISLRVNGEEIKSMGGVRRFDTFGRRRSCWWSLRPYRGKKVDLAIRIEPANAKAAVSPLLAFAAILRPESIIDRSKTDAGSWRYTTRKPPDNWHAPEFDDSSWRKGTTLLATKDVPGMRTLWDTDHIWVRRSFEMRPGKIEGLHYLVMNDDNATVYINGRLATTFFGARHTYYTLPVEKQALDLLKPGRNVLAIHCANSGGPGHIDVSFFDVISR